MLKTIWKYEIRPSTLDVVTMPIGAEILCVQVQHGRACIWALVDVEAATEDRKFLTIGTGQQIETEGVEVKYVGTYQLGGGTFVGHVFEIK